MRPAGSLENDGSSPAGRDLNPFLPVRFALPLPGAEAPSSSPQVRDVGADSYNPDDTATGDQLFQYASGDRRLPARPKQPVEYDHMPGEVVVLPDGSTVADSNSSTGQVMSPKADLSDVAARGRQTGEMFRSMLESPEGGAAASAYLYSTLRRHLSQGGTYDHQRRPSEKGGYVQMPQFRPISNINVGLFAQQAGLTLDEVMAIAGGYASLFSSNSDPSKPYGLDPTTAYYIRRGYELGQSGMFDKANPRRP
jgi:DNA-binding beta-propeller fold protein YncE